MHQRKGKKILIYFFLLLLVGSIHNINLNSLKLKEVQDIKVIGLSNEDNLILLKDIRNLNLDNIFFINGKEINNLINTNSLIQKYEIFKRYPSSLDINVDKTKFLARINDQGKIFLVGSNGKLSKSNFSNNPLPFIFGKPDIEEFLNFKKIIDQSKFSYDEIKNLYFFSSKRWDVELNNNVIIKLSKNYTKESLQLAFDFLHSKDFRDIKIVDARIKNQIILND
jgi:cell division protein FtsQ